MKTFMARDNFLDIHRYGPSEAYQVAEDGSLIKPTVDYRQCYALETYLFHVVHRRFHEQGWLGTLDFFCIVIWKANRAKSRIADRLRKKFDGNLDVAVHQLTRNIFEARDHERRLWILLGEWGFLLPMASAILTVLYPHDFTIYDVRVCDSLKSFHQLGNWTNFDRVWNEYLRFVQAVRDETPEELSLRYKDRYLWGKSFLSQLRDDVDNGFRKLEDNRPKLREKLD